MTKLIMLIGVPGSGKSSLASVLLAQYPRSQLISTDAIRAQLFGSEEIQGSWLLVWHQIERQFRQAVQQSAVAIYDATNAVGSHRAEVITLARTIGFTSISGIWLDTPIQLCLEQNRRRDRTVPEEVIWQMHSCLLNAPPTLQEGLDRLIRYSGAGLYGNCDRAYEKEPNLIPLMALLP
jgi:predicted kinase